MLFAVSGFNSKKDARNDLRPSIVTTKKLDFLRHEPGSKYKPMCADDAVLHTWGTDELKCTGDPSE